VLAMVPPSYAGQDVMIDLFDVGDATEPGVFRLVAGGKTTSGGSATKSCSYVPPNTARNSENLPNLASATTLSNCTLSGVWSSNGYDSKVVPIIWHVPSDYTCNPDSTALATNCYLRLNVQYSGVKWVDDATTWTLHAPGSPLHLIRNPTTP
jgi:hypothetical protein